MENLFIVLRDGNPITALQYKKEGAKIKVAPIEEEKFDSALFGGFFHAVVSMSSSLKEKKGLIKSTNPLKIKAILFYTGKKAKILQLLEKDRYLFVVISDSIKNIKEGFLDDKKVKAVGSTLDKNALFGLAKGVPVQEVKMSLPELWNKLDFKGRVNDTKIKKTLEPMSLEYVKDLKSDREKYENVLLKLNKKLSKELQLDNKIVEELNFILIHNLHKVFTSEFIEENLIIFRNIIGIEKQEFANYVNLDFIEEFKKSLIDELKINDDDFEILIGLISAINNFKNDLKVLGEWIKNSKIAIHFENKKLLMIS